MIYQHYSNMQWRKRQMDPIRKVQLLLCPVSNNSCTLVIMTRSIGRTLPMIIWLDIFGVRLRLTWVSMQGIIQRLILLIEIHHLRRGFKKVEKNKDSFFSQEFIPKLCRFKNRYFYGKFWTIRNKSGKQKTVRIQGWVFKYQMIQ